MRPACWRARPRDREFFLTALQAFHRAGQEKDRFGATPKPKRETRKLPMKENATLPVTNPGRHSNQPARCLRSDHYDRRRAMRSCVFLRRKRYQPAGESEARL